MTHDKITQLLPQYIDKLLGDSDRLAIEQHLKECATCSAQHKQHLSLRAIEQRIATEKHSVDPALSVRVMEQIEREEVSWFKQLLSELNPRVALSAATAIAAVLALTIGRENIAPLQESYRSLVHDAVEKEASESSGLQYTELSSQELGTVEILVPNRPIEAGEALSPEMFTSVYWPRSEVPEGAFRKTDSGKLQGHYAKSRMEANVPLVAKSTTSMQPISAVSASVPPGYRAVTIPVQGKASVEGTVNPNSRVDLTWSYQGAGEKEKSAIIVQNGKVISTQKSADGAENLATVLITEQDAKKIELAKSTGKLGVTSASPSAASEAGSLSVNDLSPRSTDYERFGDNSAAIASGESYNDLRTTFRSDLDRVKANNNSALDKISKDLKEHKQRSSGTFNRVISRIEENKAQDNPPTSMAGAGSPGTPASPPDAYASFRQSDTPAGLSSERSVISTTKRARGAPQPKTSVPSAKAPGEAPFINPTVDLITPGYRASTIEVDSASGVEGWAAPGTKVDVVLTHTDPKTGRATSQVITEGASVLSMNRSTTGSNNVSLALSTQDALKLQTARSMGRLSLTLRNENASAAYGVNDLQKSPPSTTGTYAQGTVTLKDPNTGVEKHYVIMDGRLIESNSSDLRYQQFNTVGNLFQPPQYPTWNAPQEVYGEYEENERTSVSVSPVSTFSFDVDTGSYTNTRSFLYRGQLPPPQSVRIEEFLNYFTYSDNFDYQGPFGVNTEVAPSPLEPGKFLLKVSVKARESAADEDSGWNLVFLVDVSGSMAAAEKLGLVKDSLRVLVNRMRPIDRISIVTYANGANVALPATSGADKERILSVLDSLNAGGGTNGADGIRLAYDVAAQNRRNSGVSRVILVTDGDFNVGNYSFDGLMRLIEERRRLGVSLTTLGVGRGDYNEKNLEQLANKGNGNYFYLDSFQEAQRIFCNELTRTMVVAAQDVKTHVEFNPRFVREYRLIGYDNRKMTGEEFSSESTDAGEVGAGQVTTVMYELALNFNPTGGSEPLRYQENPLADSAKAADQEIAFVRIRSKQPGGTNPGELSFPVKAQIVKSSLQSASDDFKFAAAVEYFGHILRQSKYRGGYSLQQVLSLARSASAHDTTGQRAELVRLIELAANRGLY